MCLSVIHEIVEQSNNDTWMPTKLSSEVFIRSIDDRDDDVNWYWRVWIDVVLFLDVQSNDLMNKINILLVKWFPNEWYVCFLLSEMETVNGLITCVCCDLYESRAES